MTRRVTRPVPVVAGIAIVIPARNEEGLIVACLRSVLRAASESGHPSVVVVVAHCCTDRTADVARSLLGSRGMIITDDSDDVAGARRAGVRAALRHFAGRDPRHLWLLSTDADTTVPADWVQAILRHGSADPDGVTAVAGLAELQSWNGSASGWRAYQELVAAGIDGNTHHHAYAANLAVRADAYLAVGGWPAVSPGEEHALLAALERSGRRVRRPTDVVVTTSGRLRARATGGLGDLLGRLSLPRPAPPLLTERESSR